MVVSIITPVFNCSSFIGDAIESVIEQSFQSWEMILVNDCSTDNSLAIARLYSEKDERIKVVELSVNSGAAVARNKAISMAKGRYIAFLDADDRWLPCKLEKQVNFMQGNRVPFSYAEYERIDADGNVLGHIGVPKKVSYSDLLKTCYIGCLTAMYDTDCFGKVYMPEIRKRQDFSLWLKLLKEVDYAYGINEPLAQYRVHEGSISFNKLHASKYTWKVYREVESLSFFRSAYCFSHYAIRGVLRKNYPVLARFLGVLH
ncbi:glycosyltransferase family 2 protein [Oceanimonas sp. CHS3-5]|uniref:glycosyltransferase family 2 protein n=1 Tax=Oceanimonas sp. CHS3-5 TaxID=3068186 RepID=UPI00273EC7B2|nr:glycosyltransferase family 2 protein [Oceanimonas sp. CHS3-5]MDP5291623.1 glycosyltransferase family 2 protein [Oceanimonas sp. CHS3-5]